MGRSWVLVEVGRDGTRALLHYVGHRVPRVTEIPLGIVARLAGQGAPVIVRKAV